MVDLKRRKQLKKILVISAGVFIFGLFPLKELLKFKEKGDNIYSKDGTLMVSING